MSTILFYSPFNGRSRDTESLMLAFKKQGHHVISLSQAPGNVIHDLLKEKGISTHSFFIDSTANSWYYLKHLAYFVWFCWRHKVKTVYSHLESANFVAAVGQYFIPSKVFICRHHNDMFSFTNQISKIVYQLTYRLARRIIVVSQAAKDYMVSHENIVASKIRVINLAYDFDLYTRVSDHFVQSFKKENSADLFLITIGQLIPIKRPEVSIQVLKKIVEKGINAKLIILGRGEMDNACHTLAKELGVAERVIFPGYVDNVLDYIASVDILLHPSISESSCVVVKEAGLVNVPVIVCKAVGDFDTFIEDKKNGYLVNADSYIEDASEIILQNIHSNSLGLKQSLRSDVLRLFSIDVVLPEYNSLNNL